MRSPADFWVSSLMWMRADESVPKNLLAQVCFSASTASFLDHSFTASGSLTPYDVCAMGTLLLKREFGSGSDVALTHATREPPIHARASARAPDDGPASRIGKRKAGTLTRPAANKNAGGAQSELASFNFG